MSSQIEQPATTRFLPGPVRRFRQYLREIRRQAGETNAAVSASHADTAARLDALSAQLTQLQELVVARLAELDSAQKRHAASSSKGCAS